jgi:hypothetical protein
MMVGNAHPTKLDGGQCPPYKTEECQKTRYFTFYDEVEISIAPLEFIDPGRKTVGL